MVYRKKPVEIEAFKYLGYLKEQIEGLPDWANKAIQEKIITEVEDGVRNALIIKTLEGEMKAGFGDFIIKGVNGELYPCKHDIFWKTYEEVK